MRASATLAGVLLAATAAVARDYSTPEALVRQAAAQAPAGVPGIVQFRVRAVGRSADAVYLNSETDYRDPRNLTVTVRGLALHWAEDAYGKAETFKGKEIIANGVVRRVRIDFAQGGKPTGFYYFQFHLPVTDPGRLWVRRGKDTPPASISDPAPVDPPGS